VDGIDKAWPFPKWGAGPSEAVVPYPRPSSTNLTMGDGSERALFTIWHLAGLIHEEDTVEVIDALVSDVKETLEADSDDLLSAVLSSLRVVQTDIDPIELPGPVEYALLTFHVEVIS